jgi:hypothetical protein
VQNLDIVIQFTGNDFIPDEISDVVISIHW